MRGSRSLLVVAMVVLVSGVLLAQDEEGKKKRQGLRKGAGSGAVVGLALGAVAGNAAAGAAVGAAVGGASGVMYDYDQDRQDDRTQMLADGLAGRPSAQAAPAAGAAAAPAQVQPGETVGDAGKRHMQEFQGDWRIDMWALGEGGVELRATGKAKGLAAGENATRILLQEVHVEGDETVYGGGYMVMSYDPGQGFFVENSFSFSDEVLKFVGEYLVDKNAYNYYLITHTDGAMATGGQLRSSVRLEIAVSNPSMWTARAYTHIDGQEVKVQEYKFLKVS